MQISAMIRVQHGGYYSLFNSTFPWFGQTRAPTYFHNLLKVNGYTDLTFYTIKLLLLISHFNGGIIIPNEIANTAASNYVDFSSYFLFNFFAIDV